jgi:hypothetical protein
MDLHSYPRGRALLAQAALHEAAKARARQLRAETMDSYFTATGRRLRSAWQALRHGAGRALLGLAAPRAAVPAQPPCGATPCPR